jgi:hypothetical protein
MDFLWTETGILAPGSLFVSCLAKTAIDAKEFTHYSQLLWNDFIYNNS